MTDAEMKTWIDNATIEQLLRKWRFAVAGSPFFQGEVGQHFVAVIAQRRNENPDGWVRASKTLGW